MTCNIARHVVIHPDMQSQAQRMIDALTGLLCPICDGCLVEYTSLAPGCHASPYEPGRVYCAAEAGLPHHRIALAEGELKLPSLPGCECLFAGMIETRAIRRIIEERKKTARDTLPPFEARAAIPEHRNEQAAGYVKATSDDAIRQLQDYCVVARNEAKRAGRLVAACIWEAFRAVLPDITRGFDLCSYCGHSNHGTEGCPNDRCRCRGTEEG